MGATIQKTQQFLAAKATWLLWIAMRLQSRVFRPKSMRQSAASAALCEAIVRRQNAIKSVRVTYDLTSRQIREDPMIRDRRPFVGSTRRFTFAIEGNRRYLRRTDREPWPETVCCFDGTHTLTLRHVTVTEQGKPLRCVDAIVQRGKQHECEEGESYCDQILDLPYRDDDKLERYNNWCLSDALTLNKAEYHARPERELVDGAWCEVLEWPGWDQIWVDPQLGYAPRKRFRLFPDHRTGAVRKQLGWEMRDFIEAQPGIWVPKLATLTRYGRLTKDGECVGMEDWTMVVSEININHVRDADFQVEIPPGTAVSADDNAIYATPDDKSLLLSKFADFHRGLTPLYPVSPRHNKKLIITALAIVAAAALIALCVKLFR